jgi:SagB-type dehydrogenase family enzyme
MPGFTLKVAGAALALVTLLGCEDSSSQCSCDSGSSGARDQAAATPDGTGPGASAAAVLKQVLMGRRSANALASAGRSFSTRALTREDVAALMWAGQGINAPGRPTGRPDAKGLRTAPSAGALYPIELYVAADNVSGMSPGLYWYKPEQDKLEATAKTGKLTAVIADAALDQQVLKQAAAIIVVTAMGSRTAAKYGSHAQAYVYIEIGHVAQNILLMATARGLAHRPVGAFSMTKLSTALGLPSQHAPAFLLPVGNKP